MLSRRAFLDTCLAGAGLSFAPWLRPTAASAHAPGESGSLASTRLADNLSLISGAGGDVVVLDSPDGLLLVNGGLAEHSTSLLELIRQHAGDKRVLTLFNTDWHPEHTGSNDALGKGGTRIVAHAHTKQYLGAELYVDWQNKTYKPRPPHALPSQTFYAPGKLTFGNEPVEYGPLGQAHTDGDIYVHFRSANVIAVGDVMSVGKYPIADYTSGGWLGGLVAASKTLLDLTNADTRIIPGLGPVQTRADLQAQHDMLNTMRERFVKMMKQGMGTEDMIAAGATKDFDAKWGNPEPFVSTSYRGLWLHVRELGGIV